MTVAYIANIRFPGKRAHAYQIAKNCESFIALGYEVCVIARKNFMSNDASSAQEFFKLKSRVPVMQIPCVNLLRLSPSKSLAKFAFLLLRASFKLSLFFLLFFIEHDALYYTRDPHLLRILFSFKRDVVLELHDLSDKQKGIILKYCKKLILIVCISHGLKEELIRLGVDEDKILVAHDGVDLEEFRTSANRQDVRRSLGVQPEAVLIVYTGSFYKWKGVDLFLEKWTMAPKDFYLLLVGGPQNEFERLGEIVKKQHLERVILLPSVPREQVVRFLAAGDLGLLPTSPYYDIGNKYTSPLKLFEYLAADLPVLASDVPSSREVLTEDVARFYRYDGENLAEAFSLLHEELGWLNNAREMARNYVRQYTWMERAQNILDAINERKGDGISN